jgi:hypothetical protein
VADDQATLTVEPNSRRYAELDAASGDRIRFRTANVRGKHFEMLAMFFGIGPMHTVLEGVD